MTIVMIMWCVHFYHTDKSSMNILLNITFGLNRRNKSYRFETTWRELEEEKKHDYEEVQ